MPRPPRRASRPDAAPARRRVDPKNDARHKKSEPFGAPPHSGGVQTQADSHDAPDARQLGRWVDAYAERLFRAAAVGSSPDEARDLCQETFLVAARSRFEGRSAPYTWLYGIMKNLRRDRRRRAARPTPDQPRLAVITPEAAMARSQTRARVQAAVSKLPEIQREVVVLYYLEELSVAAVAARLELPPNTVKSRLFAARSALRRALVEGRS